MKTQLRPAGCSKARAASKTVSGVHQQSRRAAGHVSCAVEARTQSQSFFDTTILRSPFADCTAPVHPRCVKADEDYQEGSEEYDVLGLGQLMIDYAAAVDDDVLDKLNVPKGGRRVISASERASVMEQLRGFDSQVSAGGSLLNSLVGIAQLAAARQRCHSAAASPQQCSSSPAPAARPAATPNSSSSSSSPSAPPRQRQLRVAMAGCCGGTDALGEFGRAQLAAAGVDVLSVADESGPWVGSATGTVMVFTTPDAQRSFLSSFSSEDRVCVTPQLLSAVAKARLVVIEGYLWELPGAEEVIAAVVQHARSVGTLVVLTAGDASVVQRHGAKVLGAIQAGVDMFVSNAAEAQELVQYLRQQTAAQQAQQVELQQQEQQQQDMASHPVVLDPQGSANLDSWWDFEHSIVSSAAGAGSCSSSSAGQTTACELAGVCPLVVVTDGSRGSYITALGQLIVVPPYWRSSAPVDTCGAGDAYCSGFLYAFLLGLDLHAMGHVAARTASAVISRHGPQLLPTDADAVAAAAVAGCSLATRFMGGSTVGSSVAGVQRLGLGAVDVDASVASVDASQVLQGAGSQ